MNNSTKTIEQRKFLGQYNKEVKEDLENLKIKFENNLTYINNSIKFYENIKPELVKDLRIKEIHNKLKELSDNIEEYDTNLEDSIGKLINNISKDLNTEQQNRLKKLIQLVLNPDKTRYVNNLIKYQMFTGTMVGLSEYGIQELLSLLFGESGEDETVVEKLIDNIFVFNIISRYTFEAGKREGYGKAIFNMVMPASLSILSSVGFDIWKTVKTKELSVDNSLKHIPFGKDVKKVMEVGERK